MPRTKKDGEKIKKVKKAEEEGASTVLSGEVVHEVHEEGDGGRQGLIFRDRFEAFRHFGVGSMEQLAERLGKSYHGESLEELLNG